MNAHQDPAMSHDAHHQPHVRRVVLPSGKTIEVVYFDNRRPGEGETDVPPAYGQLSPAPPDESGSDLHRCGTCASELVYPVAWQEAGARHWQVTLRCPNCEWARTGVFDQRLVERFDDALDRGTEALVRDLKHLMHANMEAEIERFVEALRDDHVLPGDF
jgi:hypothetical protein